MFCYGVGDDDVVRWVSVVLPCVEAESCIGVDVLAVDRSDVYAVLVFNPLFLSAMTSSFADSALVYSVLSGSDMIALTSLSRESGSLMM